MIGHTRSESHPFDTLGDTNTEPGFSSCGLITVGPHSIPKALTLDTGMIGARVASLVSDSIVLVLTFVKTFKKAHWRDRRIDDVRPTLMGILLRDSA